MSKRNTVLLLQAQDLLGLFSPGVFYALFTGTDMGMVRTGSVPTSLPQDGVWCW